MNLLNPFEGAGFFMPSLAWYLFLLLMAPSTKRNFLFLLFLLPVVYGYTQQKPVSYTLIDKKALAVKATSVEELATKLTSPYKTEIEKARAIYRWITGNIDYDIPGSLSTATIYAGLWQPDGKTQAEADKEYHDRIVDKVFRERKGICDGYSRLFKTLCEYAGLRCERITGLIRWSSDNIGQFTNRKHAWNAVYINNGWKLVDATWGSGYQDIKTDSFVRAHNDFFFCTPPVEFFNDHFPDNAQWSLLPRTPSRDEFYSYPFYFPEFYRRGVTGINHLRGLIDVRVTDKLLLIELNTTKPVKELYIYEYPFVEDPPATRHTYTVSNNKVTYRYTIQSDKTEKIYVVLNDEIILSYNIRWAR
jgi:transglutaminase/protease-like cytokinesis protein 3